MKLTVPFINFKNYILLRCYTNNSLLPKAFPITVSSRIPPIKPKENIKGGFRTCYGYLSSLKRSASVPLWESIHTVVDHNGILLTKPDQREGFCDFDWSHNEDPYHSLDGMSVVKITSPWFLEEDTGVPFVYASHLRNPTQFRIPSAVCDFKYQHGLQLFNYIAKTPQNFIVNAGTPILALYPLSDKKLYVESVYDVNKHLELKEKTSTRAFFGNNIMSIKKAICSHAK